MRVTRNNQERENNMTNQGFGKFSKNVYGIEFETISEKTFTYGAGLMAGIGKAFMNPPKDNWIGYTNYINGYKASGNFLEDFAAKI